MKMEVIIITALIAAVAIVSWSVITPNHLYVG